MAIRDTQVIRETAASSEESDIRVSQAFRESAGSSEQSDIRISQVFREVAFVVGPKLGRWYAY